MPPFLLLTAAAVLLSTTATIAQNSGAQNSGGGAIDCPPAVPAGGSITITVGPNDTTLDLQQNDGQVLASIPVTPGKSVSIPVPPLPPGASLVVRLGNAERKRARIVEILQPSP